MDEIDFRPKESGSRHLVVHLFGRQFEIGPTGKRDTLIAPARVKVFLRTQGSRYMEAIVRIDATTRCFLEHEMRLSRDWYNLRVLNADVPLILGQWQTFAHEEATWNIYTRPNSHPQPWLIALEVSLEAGSSREHGPFSLFGRVDVQIRPVH